MENVILPLRSAFATGLLTLMWGCVAGAATEAPHGAVVLWSAEDQWVKIEGQDDPAASPNDHPVSLDTASVANALGALRVRMVDPDTGAESQRAVFTRAEVGNLAPQVAAGLAKAGPRQDLTFSTLGSSPFGGGLIKALSVNSGRIFFEDAKLNVIFGELQANYRKKNVYGRRDQDFDPPQQGTRQRASKQKWTLATLPGIALHASRDGSLRNDWVSITPGLATSQKAVSSSERPEREPPAAVAAPAPSATAATAPAASIATVPSSADQEAALERRLRALQALKDKGLISEEAYNTKVQQLLSEL